MGLDIVIVGSGLAGLAAGAFLRKQHTITILEKSKLDFQQNDYGISVIANAYSLLQKAGIDDTQLDMAVMTKLWQRTAGNEEIVTADFDTRKTFGAPSVLTKRSHLQRELYRLATSAALKGQPAEIIENIKVKSVDANTGMVNTSDGRSFSGDLLIGADGINSVVRAAVLSSDGKSACEALATSHDLLAYMAQIPLSALASSPSLSFLADPETSAGLVNFSSPRGRTDKLRILGYHTSPREFQLVGYASEEEFAAQFDQFGTSIIKGVPASRAKHALSEFDSAITDLYDHHRSGDGTVEVWGIRDLDPLPRWSLGKTLLIGDSCHAVTPHAGQGCNIAFEDAEALGVVLEDVNSDMEIESALEKFLKIRKERAEFVANGSRHMGALLGPEAGPFDEGAKQALEQLEGTA
ncbi:hypothetical protein M409DRAFT_63790 [Zasmidium cellare ATCC 36951]|uniref:FAD-binding domain-containing protein n=1 Tax=Zasmidium cellare ATCC 36951 TaxID=1080233 RepID=A0A6A6CWP6_ZASCE|nr:uncharacterized protein M409DRAFT_63790 [Zasmidium cellare ATCC 36951]KAF2171554.1 hypothetical protein M409DRAFT_63790 [Zasmidium cellare ATCC 36951]